MLKEAKLLLEFQDEAVKADIYLRNHVAIGPIINGKQVMPKEAFTRITLLIDYIRVQGSKCYLYVNPKTIPAYQRYDKLVNIGRVRVFIGYSETINKQFKVYAPELGYTFRSSRVRIDETIAGGIIDLRIRNCAAGLQETPNILDNRKPRNRPKK